MDSFRYYRYILQKSKLKSFDRVYEREKGI